MARIVVIDFSFLSLGNYLCALQHHAYVNLTPFIYSLSLILPYTPLETQLKNTLFSFFLFLFFFFSLETQSQYTHTHTPLEALIYFPHSSTQIMTLFSMYGLVSSSSCIFKNVFSSSCYPNVSLDLELQFLFLYHEQLSFQYFIWVAF